ncbi:hypothetical protein QUB33_04815 [Microcoleus sp. B3-A4]
METDLHRRKGRTKFAGPTPHSLAKLIEGKLKKAAKVSILTAFNFPIH